MINKKYYKDLSGTCVCAVKELFYMYFDEYRQNWYHGGHWHSVWSTYMDPISELEIIVRCGKVCPTDFGQRIYDLVLGTSGTSNDQL